MPEIFRIWVPGIPQPGGSKKGFVVPVKEKPGKYQAVITEDNRKSKPWRQSVAKERIDSPVMGPIAVRFIFQMPRPKSHFGKYGLLPSAPTRPTVKPDVTKLIRSTEDALKGIAWIDDSQIVFQFGEKVYSEKPGAWILIASAESEGIIAAILSNQFTVQSAAAVASQMGMRYMG
jgi:Holliday junction resolvase RusA-like endonuclease